MRNPSTLIFLMAALLLAVNAPAHGTLLSRATIIDGTGSPPQKDISIVMENGRIRDMGPGPKIPTPPGATVLDLTG